ncbi:MAG: hypothetical protein CMF39_04280 [Legionellaceae bacterium]|nr:hypothetical protein [Legionellaceae bacterium]|tara:strand:+ start:225 stop:425 length:201 start_codon:yes stop_codon:yes gene_type:complete
MFQQIEAVLHTIAYGCIIVGMLLIAPKFFSAGDVGEGHHHHKFGFVLSWFFILAGLILEIIAVWAT